jgi:hypothetical protein
LGARWYPDFTSSLRMDFHQNLCKDRFAFQQVYSLREKSRQKRQDPGLFFIPWRNDTLRQQKFQQIDR